MDLIWGGHRTKSTSTSCSFARSCFIGMCVDYNQVPYIIQIGSRYIILNHDQIHQYTVVSQSKGVTVCLSVSRLDVCCWGRMPLSAWPRARWTWKGQRQSTQLDRVGRSRYKSQRPTQLCSKELSQKQTTTETVVDLPPQLPVRFSQWETCI